MSENLSLKLYAVRSKDGKWYKSQHHRRGWQDDVSDARFFSTPGPAKTQITYFATHFPDDGIPDLIEITATEYTVVDQVLRVKKAARKKSEVNALRDAKDAKLKLADAERVMRDAMALYERLK